MKYAEALDLIRDPVMASNSTTNWQRLLEETGAILQGHFRLSSGLHSPVYIQCARVLQYPWHAERLGQGLARAIAQHTPPDLILSPALGGVIIGHETARALHVPFLFMERVAGAMHLRRGFRIEPGQRFWVVEDVMTTGTSAREVAAVAEQMGGRLEGFATIVDRGGMATLPDIPRVALLRLDIPTYPPQQCPLCRERLPLTTPGSRVYTSTPAEARD